MLPQRGLRAHPGKPSRFRAAVLRIGKWVSSDTPRRVGPGHGCQQWPMVRAHRSLQAPIAAEGLPARGKVFFRPSQNGNRVILKIAAFVLPLGLDTLAIAIALGLRGLRPWRPALTFAIFEGFMPILGIVLARVVGLRFETAAVVIGGIILIGIGFHSFREAIDSERELKTISFSSLRSTFLAGLAISTDELAIGFPLGASQLPVATVLIAIAVQTLFVTALGIAAGNRVSAALGLRASRYAGIAAGIAFSAVGVWLIAEKVLAS